MDISRKVYDIVSGFNNFMAEEIGDQDGFYDKAIREFSDKYYDHEDGSSRQPESFDWIGEAKSALLQTRNTINADDHPLGPLKTWHKINLNHSLGQALIELKKLKFPGWKPLLERLSP